MQFEAFQQLLRDHLKNLGLNPYSAAVRSGLPERAIKSVLEGIKPNFTRINEICKALELNLSITPAHPRHSSPIPDYIQGTGEGKSAWPLSEPDAAGSHADSWPQEIAEIDFLGTIAAGGANTPNEGRILNIEEGRTIRLSLGFSKETLLRHGGLSAARVQGNSMFPTYKDGDVVMFYRQDPASFQPESLLGRECAIIPEDDDGFLLKRLRRADSGQSGEWNLESLNAYWPTESNVKVRHISPIRYVQMNLS